jgi:glyoxylase-like metal-dependent hydrolase (beta-lactamase superfamily II)
VPAAEWNWWMGDVRMAVTPEAGRGGFNAARRVFGPIASSVTRFQPDTEVLPGIRAIAAYGHTPGHTAFLIEGGSRRLLYWADTTNVAALLRVSARVRADDQRRGSADSANSSVPS